jgi:soluble cytochrome b562
MKTTPRLLSYFLPSLLGLLGLCACSIAKADTDTPLEISMQHIKKAYKELALDLQQPQDADKAGYLTLTATLKTEAQKARGDVPKLAADLPPDQKDAMVKAYQKSMDDFSQSIDALSAAIQAGQWDAARKLIDTLKQSMIDGHKAFRKKE